MQFVHLDRANIPQDEHRAAELIETNLNSMSQSASSFAHTVGLYLHTRELLRDGHADYRTVSAWTRIAGRNGAIEAHALFKLGTLLNEAAKAAPYIAARVNQEKRKAALKLLSSEFGEIASVRNSTAHPGELVGSDREYELHSIKDDYEDEFISISNSQVLLTDTMYAHDDKLIFSSTFRGRMARYELSAPKSKALSEVVALYHQAYEPLEDPTSVRLRSRSF